MDARLLFVHTLSPLHAGTGQGVGVIDLPVAREKATGLPYLPGSSLKGVLRDSCPDPEQRKRIFGPDREDEDSYAGSVQISDHRLLLLPVRSLAGTFAWVTSPYILRRFYRDAENLDIPGIPSCDFAPASIESCFLSTQSFVIMVNNQVILEDLDLSVEVIDKVDTWAEWLGQHLFPDEPIWQQMLRERFCLVHDDVLSFLLDTATEVFARIRLKEEAKAVETGGLWYEEALPTETVLAGLVMATPVKAESEEVFRTIADLIAKPLQLGGKSTVGRGLCRLRLVGGNRNADT